MHIGDLPFLIVVFLLDELVSCDSVELLFEVFSQFPIYKSILLFWKKKFLLPLPNSALRNLNLKCTCECFSDILSNSGYVFSCNVPNIVKTAGNYGYFKTFVIQDSKLLKSLYKYKSLCNQVTLSKRKNIKERGIYEIRYEGHGFWQIINFVPYSNMSWNEQIKYLGQRVSLDPRRRRFYWTLMKLEGKRNLW